MPITANATTPTPAPMPALAAVEGPLLECATAVAVVLGDDVEVVANEVGDFVPVVVPV